MKILKIISAVCLLSLGSIAQTNNEVSQKTTSLNLPGDNLSLNGVLDIFKESTSTQSFETELNNPDTKLNNLDLNNDGKVDYLRVHEQGRKKNRTLVIQAILGEKEIQDVAVINIHKKGDKIAQVQIIGDKALYGKDYIIEPKIEENTTSINTNTSSANTNANKDDGATTNYITNNYNNRNAGYYNSWGWPMVSMMYGPSYSYWNSPYYWGYYPMTWNSWRPIGYTNYCGYWCNRPFYSNYYRSNFIVGNGFRHYNRTYSNFYRTNNRNNFYAKNNTIYGHRIISNNVQKSNWGGYNKSPQHYNSYHSQSGVKQNTINNAGRVNINRSNYGGTRGNGGYGGMRSGGSYHSGGQGGRR